LVVDPLVDAFWAVFPWLIASVLFMFMHGARRYGWAGIEAEDPMIKARSEAYPVSYQRRTQHD
jgi:hypothetical protein